MRLDFEDPSADMPPLFDSLEEFAHAQRALLAQQRAEAHAAVDAEFALMLAGMAAQERHLLETGELSAAMLRRARDRTRADQERTLMAMHAAVDRTHDAIAANFELILTVMARDLDGEAVH